MCCAYAFDTSSGLHRYYTLTTTPHSYHHTQRQHQLKYSLHARLKATSQATRSLLQPLPLPQLSHERGLGEAAITVAGERRGDRHKHQRSPEGHEERQLLRLLVVLESRDVLEGGEEDPNEKDGVQSMSHSRHESLHCRRNCVPQQGRGTH